jgi:ABC-type phosphate/phosphonate transport system substrate-binding protein
MPPPEMRPGSNRARGTTLQASLPMYNLPEMRPANTAFWLAIRTEAERLGLHGLPQELDFARKPVPAQIEANTVFTQVCGWPLQTIYAGQATLLGVPAYDATHCAHPGRISTTHTASIPAAPTHAGVFVVRRDAAFRRVGDLRGCDFVFNSVHSNSGMNLPRRVIAGLAGGKPFFGSIAETHSQPRNLELVASGEAAATCVDCVTFAFFVRRRPEMGERLRVLAVTPPTPAIPFVTSAATDARTKTTLAAALRCVATAPEWEPVRAAMLLLDIVPPDRADYTIPCRYAAEAAALGYPALR